MPDEPDALVEPAGPQQPESLTDRKSQFLETFRELKIIADVLAKLKVSRKVFRDWQLKDAQFREDLADAKADVIDFARRIAYQKVGMLPCKDVSRFKWANDSVLLAILKQDPDFKDNFALVAPPSALPIKGMDEKLIGALLSPDPDIAGEPKQPMDTAEISMEGVLAPKRVPAIIQALTDKLAAQKAAKLQHPTVNEEGHA